MLVSDCCKVPGDGGMFCPNCGDICEWIEPDPDEETYPVPNVPQMTGAIRAAMRTEPNGDKYVDD